MKILICDKTEKEYIEQMRAAGLTVDVRDDITPEELGHLVASEIPQRRRLGGDVEWRGRAQP